MTLPCYPSNESSMGGGTRILAVFLTKIYLVSCMNSLQAANVTGEDRLAAATSAPFRRHLIARRPYGHHIIC